MLSPIPPEIPGGVTGARLAGQVLYHWRELPELQHRALMCMALTALDDPTPEYPAATYFGGYERIAGTWRSPFPADDGTPETRKKRKNILNEVRKVMRALEKAGAVKVVDTGKLPCPGNAQTFRLVI
jgi:hypothetical protein